MSGPQFTILGANGFVGSHLVRHLKSTGMNVREATRASWPAAGEHLGHAIYAVGLTADFRTRPFETIEAHVSLLARTLETQRFESFLYLSSARVYRGAPTTSEDTLLRVAPTDADRLYDLSKLCGEALCLASPDANVRVARLSNVFGAGDDPHNFLRSVIDDAMTRGSVEFRQGLKSAKDYVGVDDVCRALAGIATRGRSRLYNVAAGVNTTHGEIAEALRAAFGASVSVAPDAAEASNLPIDVGRLAAEFEWRPISVLRYLRTIDREAP